MAISVDLRFSQWVPCQNGLASAWIFQTNQIMLVLQIQMTTCKEKI